jgi:hypothetical protein
MSIFSAKKSVAETTGVDLLRAAAAARVKRINYATLARDFGITTEHFLDFANGRRELTDATLGLLAKEFFDAEFDSAANRLRSKNRMPPTSMGIPPPRFDPTIPRPHHPPPFDPAAPRTAINPGPGLTKAWDGKRPGWAE